MKENKARRGRGVLMGDVFVKRRRVGGFSFDEFVQGSSSGGWRA